MTRTTVYPLVLEPILKEKVWGGRRLEHYGKVLAAGSQVGESWEVADRRRVCCRRSDQSEGAQGSPSDVGLAPA